MVFLWGVAGTALLSNVFLYYSYGGLPVDTFLLTNEGTINVDFIDFLATCLGIRCKGSRRSAFTHVLKTQTIFL